MGNSAPDRVRSLLEGLDGLPPMPPIAHRLMELGDLTTADLSEVAALLELNPNTMHSRLRSARARFEELRIQLTGGDA